MRAGGTKRRKRGRRGGGEGGRDDGRERRAGALKMCSVLRVPGDEPPRKTRITQLRNGEARDPRRGEGGGGRGAKRGRSGVGAGKEGRRKRGTAMRADPKKNSVAGKKPIPSHTPPPAPVWGGIPVSGGSRGERRRELTCEQRKKRAQCGRPRLARNATRAPAGGGACRESHRSTMIAASHRRVTSSRLISGGQQSALVARCCLMSLVRPGS